jgi:hypothetical protein
MRSEQIFHIECFVFMRPTADKLAQAIKRIEALAALSNLFKTWKFRQLMYPSRLVI